MLDVAGQLVGLDEGQRPVQVLAGVAVVPGLRAGGGQVAHGPGGMVLQAGRVRDLEGLLQLDRPPGSPSLRRAEPMLVRAWVSLVVQPPGQLDRPPGPALGRLDAVGQHVQLGLVAVGHGQLVAGGRVSSTATARAAAPSAS